jgi:hypothetical protein
VSFIAGLVWGAVIAALTVASEHYGPSFGRLALNGNGALAIPAVLIPLAIYWGYNWVANRWSGRSLLPSVAFVAGLWIGSGLVGPADAVLYPQGPESTLVNAIPGVLFTGAIFVLPVALVGGGLYWLLKSERFPAGAIVLLLLYLIGLALTAAPVLSAAVPFLGAVSFIGPVLGGGVIAGTAAGHAWRRGRGGWGLGLLVLVLMLVGVLGAPYVAAGGADELRRLLPAR